MNMAARACRHDRKTERFQTSNLIQSRRRSEEGCFTEDHITKYSDGTARARGESTPVEAKSCRPTAK